MGEAGITGTIRIATLNCRNTADGWRRRRPLLVRQLVELAPDVIGLQELRTFPNQGATIGRSAARDGGLAYRRHRTLKTGLLAFWEGIATLSLLPIVETASIPLGGQHRVAQRVSVALPASGVLQVFNAHMVSGDEAERQRQVARLLEAMDEHPGAAQVLLGDFNASPAMESIQHLLARFRSAHVVANGEQPRPTVPTPLRRGVTGPGVVMDYILVNDRIEVHHAGLVFDQADPSDPHLVASDHYGLTATVSVLPPPAAAGPVPG